MSKRSAAPDADMWEDDFDDRAETFYPDDNSDSRNEKPKGGRKKKLITALIVLAVVGAIIAGFYFVASNRPPEMKSIKSLSALSDSALVQFECSGNPDYFIVSYKSDKDGLRHELICYDRVVAIKNIGGGLLDVEIIPVKDDVRCPSLSSSIPLSPRASITSMTVLVNRAEADGSVARIPDPIAIDSGTDTLDVSWEYEGEGCGFFVYLDPLTPGKAEILPSIDGYVEPGAARSYTVKELCPDTTYRFSVVPDIAQPGWYVRTFKTAPSSQYAGEFGYTTYDAIITGTTTLNTTGSASADAINIDAIIEKWSALAISSVKAEENYQIALVLEGAAFESMRNCVIGAYSYDESGALNCYYQQVVDINSVGTTSPRVVYRPFKAPSDAGVYNVKITVNGRLVAEKPLTVLAAGE